MTIPNRRRPAFVGGGGGGIAVVSVFSLALLCAWLLGVQQQQWGSQPWGVSRMTTMTAGSSVSRRSVVVLRQQQEQDDEFRKLDAAATESGGDAEGNDWIDDEATSATAAAAAAAAPASVPSPVPAAAAGISTELRLNWSNLEVTSPLAKFWHSHQRNCSRHSIQFYFQNVYGLGHELHMWTQAICNAANAGYRIRTALPWSYRDEHACRSSSSRALSASSSPSPELPAQLPESALQCYFPAAEPDDCLTTTGGTSNDKVVMMSGRRRLRRRQLDPTEASRIFYHNSTVKNYEVVYKNCKPLMKTLNATIRDVRASAIEYLFSGTSTVLINEARRQLNILFGAHDARTFERLITVHIRWGDKRAEIDLVAVDAYVQAVHQLLSESSPTSSNIADPGEGGGKVGIYLSTEDPLAVELFQKEADKHGWVVFVDVYVQEFASVRDGKYNGNPRLAKRMQGRPGLVALASLLVAMQANDFVLTMASNWSQLMNELRKLVLDPRCNNCTRMIDLTPGAQMY